MVDDEDEDEDDDEEEDEEDISFFLGFTGIYWGFLFTGGVGTLTQHICLV